MNDLIHSSYYRPRIFPIKGTGTPAEIDRAQTIDPTGTSNRERVEEIGRDGAVGHLKKRPSVAYRLTQYEYGSLEFWQKLVNATVKGNVGETPIYQSDFKTPYFDICGYMTDDVGTHKGTIWYPSLRTTGFSLTLGDPQAIIERGFDFIGEAACIFEGGNQYFIYQKEDISGDDTDYDITLDKTAAVDPDVASKYMQRVARITAGGVFTELVKADGDYTETATIVTVASVSTGDTIKLYYTSASAPDTIFTLNDADAAGLLGDSVSIYLYVPASGKPSSSDYIYRLQSVTIDVRFDREDIGELGNKDIVARGITNTTTAITLGEIAGGYTVEEVLRGVDSSFGKLDISKFSDEISLIIKIFSDNTKGTFKYGMRLDNLTPTEFRLGAAVNEYVKKDNTLGGEEILISADTTEIGI